MKRHRQPKLKEGELRLYWGKMPHENPDVCIAWRGDRSMKGDANLLHYSMCSKHPDLFAKPLFSVMTPSLLDELSSRGYDITTIKFSIMKRKTIDNDHPVS